MLTAGPLAIRTRVEVNLQSQVKELRDLIGACSKLLRMIEAYVSELHKQEMKGSSDNSLTSSQDLQPLEITGECHFLYTGDSRVFGYMKLVPETLSVSNRNGCEKEGSPSVKTAEFTILSGVLRKAEEALLENRGDQEESRDTARIGRSPPVSLLLDLV